MTSPVGADRRRDLDRFYELLDRLSARLGGPRCLRECTGANGWPERGVYFFFEEGGLREGGLPRVVRVGTHAISLGHQRSLWQRLYQHRGTLSGARPGGGNHRQSIFRLHVGTALLNRDHYPPEVRRAWNAPEADPGLKDTEHYLERAVSDHIGRMPFLWLAVPDAPGRDSHRACIEANAIGLLSDFGRTPIDPPSPSWLGRWADAPKVRESGLWNVNHVDGSYTPRFLDVFESYVDGRSSAHHSAPPTSPAGPASPVRSETPAGGKGEMLLHDAILEILGDREMTFSEIAAALNRSDLYRKRDGSRIKQDQVGARVRSPHYAELFVLNRSVSPQRVRARLPSLPPPGHRARASSAAEAGRGPGPARNPSENAGCSSRRPGSRS